MATKFNQGKFANKPTKTSRKSKRSNMPLGSKNSNATVRKIENGYLVSEHGYNGDKYFTKEYFSPTNPLENVTKIKFGKK